MAESVHLHGKVRRLGNSLAFIIPADVARASNIREGSEVDVELNPNPLKLLGLLKDLPYVPFSREDLYDDD